MRPQVKVHKMWPLEHLVLLVVSRAFYWLIMFADASFTWRNPHAHVTDKWKGAENRTEFVKMVITCWVSKTIDFPFLLLFTNLLKLYLLIQQFVLLQLRSNPFYEPRSSSADSNTSDMSTKRRAPQPPSVGPIPAVAPGGLAPKTSAPEGTSTPPALAPSAVTAVIGRELASSSPKVSRPQHIVTLFDAA